MAKRKTKIEKVTEVIENENDKMLTKEEVNSSLTPSVKSQVNLNINKEDIYDIIVSDKEDEIQSKLDILNKELENLRLDKSVIKDKIENIAIDKIKSIIPIQSNVDITISVYTSTINSKVLNIIPIKDLSDLDKIKDIKKTLKLKSRETSLSKHKFYFNNTCKFQIYTKVKVDLGFEEVETYNNYYLHFNELSDKDKKYIEKEVNKLISEYEEVNNKIIDLQKEINDLEIEYYLVSDKSNKAKFIKNIISQNPELSKLLA